MHCIWRISGIDWWRRYRSIIRLQKLIDSGGCSPEWRVINQHNLLFFFLVVFIESMGIINENNLLRSVRLSQGTFFVAAAPPPHPRNSPHTFLWHSLNTSHVPFLSIFVVPARVYDYFLWARPQRPRKYRRHFRGQMNSLASNLLAQSLPPAVYSLVMIVVLIVTMMIND